MAHGLVTGLKLDRSSLYGEHSGESRMTWSVVIESKGVKLTDAKVRNVPAPLRPVGVRGWES